MPLEILFKYNEKNLSYLNRIAFYFTSVTINKALVGHKEQLL